MIKILYIYKLLINKKKNICNKLYMETNDEIIYEQYEWIYYFFEGFDVTSFNNNIIELNGNNNLNNFPNQLSFKSQFKKPRKNPSILFEFFEANIS